MDIMIRSGQLKDYEDVLKIMNQVQELHVKWRPDIYRENTEFFLFDDFKEIIKQDGFYVAELDKKVIGVMEIEYRHIESSKQVTRDILYIHVIAVDHAYRGKGVAHQFFAKLKLLKEEKHLDAIELQVNAKNTEAYEMYKKYGFVDKSIHMELL